jgi:hypothetical protein
MKTEESWPLWLWRCLLLLGLVLLSRGLGGEVTTATIDDVESAIDVGDTGPMAIVMGVMMLVAVGVGAMLTLMAGGIAASILAIGVFSSSVIVGFLRRSPTLGLKALFLQLGALSGCGCGLLSALLAVGFFELAWKPAPTFLVSGFGGLLLGLLIGHVFNLAWSRLAQFVIKIGCQLRQRIKG